MKLIAQVKLYPTPEQADSLKRTLETANAAANYISDYAWDHKVFRQYDLHHASYYDVRDRFGLSAQVVVRILAKVGDAYKLDRKTKRTFKPHGSIAYDKRILSWKLDAQTISIWTVDGRETIPFVADEHHLELLRSMQGEADLVYRRGQFYVHQVCEVDEPPTEEVDDFLGVDLGLANIATDSEDNRYSSNKLMGLRQRRRRQRTRLMKKGTKSSRRRQKALSGRERRMMKDVNHQISKEIVQRAQDTGRGVALEDLSGIRDRVTVRRQQRADFTAWAFYQLRTFIEYKAKRAGILIVLVDPRYTSQACSRCGHVDRQNRSSQDTFLCVACGCSLHADRVPAG